MDDISFSIDTSQLDAALSRLPIQIQKRILRPALEAAGEVIAESIRSMIPETWPARSPGSDALPPGILKADIHTDVMVSTDKGANVRVGPTEIAGYVARWQNDGFTLTTHGRKRNRKAIQRKSGKPNPIPGLYFMQAGTDAAADRAVQVLINAIADGLGMDLSGYEGVGKDEDYGGENY